MDTPEDYYRRKTEQAEKLLKELHAHLRECPACTRSHEWQMACKVYKKLDHALELARYMGD